MIVDEKKPVAAPRYITRDWSDPGHEHCDAGTMTITPHVRNLDLTVFVKVGHDGSDGRLDAMSAWFDAAEVSQRGDDTDRAVAAHAEVSDIVEEQHAGHATVVDWCAQQRADERFREIGRASCRER